MILFIDNFDSFTFNLVHCLESLSQKVEVVRGSGYSVEECLLKKPKKIIIGPGPGSPEDAYLSKDLLLKAFQLNIPVLGVCLGHQLLAQSFGAKIIRSAYPMHGKVSSIIHNQTGLFKGLPQNFTATRYHSLIVNPSTIPKELIITAWTNDGTIMGLQHYEKPLHGVQFHPESIMTEHGQEIFCNFLR